MSNIFDFIQLYTLGKNSLDKDFSIELYNFLRSFYAVEDYVKSIEFMSNPYSPYFAFYLPHTKQLFVNFDKMADDINSYVNNLNISDKDKVLSSYLCLFHFINHEFKHICQEKEKGNKPDAIESRLLVLCDQLEQYYRAEGMLFSRYKIDPIERQAELSSLSQFISMAKSAEITTLATDMTNRYLINAKKGYSDFLRDYPAKYFLENYEYYNDSIHKLIEELDEYPITQFNVQSRVELGLRLEKKEYEKIKIMT